MTDWYVAGLDDDMRPHMFAAADAGRVFALVTIVAAEGGGPRGVGAQMVVTADDMAGFLSGGCIEADVALQARGVLETGEPLRLVYGRGSPFVDTKLPCGGRLELLVERFAPDDAILPGIREAMANRRLVTLLSDGRLRRLVEGDVEDSRRLRAYLPPFRLIVIGGDPFALAIAEEGLRQGWRTTIVRPKGPQAPPPLEVDYRREGSAAALDDLAPDAWTAVAVATHDGDLDHEAVKAALSGEAAYVGVLGARRRLPERLARLTADGVPDAALARLYAPIGLPIQARSPREVAVSVVAQIIRETS